MTLEEFRVKLLAALRIPVTGTTMTDDEILDYVAKHRSFQMLRQRGQWKEKALTLERERDYFAGIVTAMNEKDDD